MTRLHPLRMWRALLAAAAALGCYEVASAPALPGAGVMVVVFDGHPADTMRVHVTHRPTLDAARAYLRGEKRAHIPAGPIVRGAGIDPKYPFHFVPDSVRLVEAAIELCDGAPMHTPEEVDAFFAGSTGSVNATRATWCPWNARPVEVEPAP